MKNFVTVLCGLILAFCAASLLNPGAAEAALRGTGTYSKSVLITINNTVVSIDSGLRDLIRSARVIPVFSMPRTKMKIDNSSLPLQRNPGTADYRISNGPSPLPGNPSDGSPGHCSGAIPCSGSDSGDFRLGCQFAHFAYDDPIVYPGQPNKSHLHVFFGNTQTDYLSTVGNIRSRGGSTCAGGFFNMSGYWVPAMVDAFTGQVKVPDSNLVYYKPGYDSPALANTIVPMPRGLRMIACSPTNLDGTPNTAICGHSRWACGQYGYTIDGVNNRYDMPTLANCAELRDQTQWPSAGYEVVNEILFPRCWDGVNLDGNPAILGDHASHMAFVGAGEPCPTGFPVRFLQVSYNIHYFYKKGENPDHWYLSSDDPSGIAGRTAHGDWFMGWKRGPDYPGDPNDEDIMQTLIDTCSKAFVDCHANFIGPYKSGKTGSTQWRTLN